MAEEIKIGEVKSKEKEETTDEVIEKAYVETIKKIMDKTGGAVVKCIIKRRNLRGQLEYCETVDVSDPELLNDIEEYCANKGGGGHYEIYVRTEKGDKQIGSFDIEGDSHKWRRQNKVYKDDETDEEDVMLNNKKSVLLDQIRMESRREMDVLLQQLNELKQQNIALQKQLEEERQIRQRKEMEAQQKLYEERLSNMQKTLEQGLKTLQEQQSTKKETDFADIMKAINEANKEMYSKMMELLKDVSKKDEKDSVKAMQEQMNKLMEKLFDIKDGKKDTGLGELITVFSQLKDMAMDLANQVQPQDAKTKILENIISAFTGMVTGKNPEQSQQLNALPEAGTQQQSLDKVKEEKANHLITMVRTALKAKVPPEKMAETLFKTADNFIKLGVENDIIHIYQKPREAVEDFLTSLPEGKGLNEYISQVAEIAEQAVAESEQAVEEQSADESAVE